jgi:hypothetical protein
LSHTCIGFFEIGSGELFAWSWLQTVILLISASWVARIYRHEPPMPGWKTILFRFNCKGWRSGSSSRASAYLNLARREALNSSPITTKKKRIFKLGLVAHTWNPSYSRGRGRRYQAILGKVRPYLKNKINWKA